MRGWDAGLSNLLVESALGLDEYASLDETLIKGFAPYLNNIMSFRSNLHHLQSVTCETLIPFWQTWAFLVTLRVFGALCI